MMTDTPFEQRMDTHLQRIEGLLEEILRELRRADGADVPLCPRCSSDDLADESTMGEPRTRCVACGHVWKPEEGK
jgi:Zn ribbon nucleic-acid-binding protein